MEIIKGKKISGHDNDSYMLRGFDDYVNCKICGNPKVRPINPNFKLNKKKYDLSDTYDGYQIVSRRFKNFCEENSFFDLVFLDIPKEPNFFVLRPRLIVELDHIRSKTIFAEYCKTCNRYNSIAGPAPIFCKKNNTVFGNTIYRSDVEYGFKNEQHPILLVNLEVYQKMRKGVFKGLHFKNIYE